MRLLGIDTGGTFTDFVHFDGQRLRVHKVLSTPEAPERAIAQGVEEMGLETEGLVVIHGSTVATNAVLESKGARTAYIANYGLGDVLTLARQARQALYELQPAAVTPPVPAELCLETGGRLGADASVLEPLEDYELEALAARLRELAPEAVAINLLFSFLDERFEQSIEAAAPEGIFVSRSSVVLPELREYERGIATWLNSYVGPLMQRYLGRLEGTLAPARVKVMQSHGGTISAGQAGGQAVQLLLSGPAGGLMGARHVAAASGHSRLMTLDMGGTSTDVALIDGDIQLTAEGHVASYPVAVPMVDLHTIGAGGGSIASVDAGGLLKVGPESAGASPGPACYGQGGQRATVTDAHVALGRLPADTALGGGMRLDTAAADAAVEALAADLGLEANAAANGVIRLANEHMAQALRVISVQRGLDPREYTLVSFGGAGGLHVCELAAALGMQRAMVPIHAGVLSALGMLVAPQGRQLSQTFHAPLLELTDATVNTALERLAEAGRAQLEAEGVSEVRHDDALELRYHGQSSTLRLPWRGVEQSARDFHEAHRGRFGHALDAPVELVTLRVGLSADTQAPELPSLQAGEPGAPTQAVRLACVADAVPVYDRRRLAAGQSLAGPALVSEAVSTTLVADGWRCSVDGIGNMLLELC